MMDIGKRIERSLWLTALLGATLTTARSAAAEQAVIESTLVACESSVIYRRRTVGQVSVAAVTELMLFDANNPRALLYQLERLRADLKELPSSSGSSRPERMVDEVSTLLRRSHPGELQGVDNDGQRAELAELARHHPCRIARSGRGDHRDATDAARRHAAAVGRGRTTGDALTGASPMPSVLRADRRRTARC